jgi:hypothetical protein
MSSPHDRLRRPAPRSTSHGKNIVDIEIFNDLPQDLAVSEAELATLELLLGWDWLGQLLCEGSEPDV